MLDLPTFTLIHVVISVLGIIAGLVVVGGLLAGARLDGWTTLFLATTAVTSVTGFGFPFTRVSPPHIVGAVSILVLAVCFAARYWKRMEGRWRAAYVVTAVTALYLNVFVLVAQLFAKTAPLAPQKTAFATTQALVLALFTWIGWMALRNFRLGKATS